jgi:hypothetical protein
MKKIIGLFLVLMFFFSLACFSAATSISPQVTATLLNQDPDPVQQGDVVEARFKIENLGGATSESVVVEILPKYPFTLYSGEAKKDIGKLRAGQTGADAVIVDYKLKVDELAAEGDNEIELRLLTGYQTSISYVNNEFLIDVNDYDVPNLKVFVKENTILSGNSRGEITIEIANVDVADVKFLELTLLPNEEYMLLSSSNYVYLGDVDSDDTESEDFEIYVKDIKENKLTIPVNLKYQDSNENKYEQNVNLNINIYSSGELYKYGLKQRSIILPIVVIIIGAGIGYFYWRKRRKR